MNRMSNYVIVIAVLVLAFSACEIKRKSESNQVSEKETIVEKKRFETKSGKVFRVIIDKSKGASINKVRIEPQNFSISNETYELGEIDPVEDIFLTDLDNNGYEEIYVLTRGIGSGSYASIYGLASNRDKSATPIYVPPLNENQLKGGAMFEGFMGHNSFKLHEGKLYCNFPVYKEGDANNKPSGGEKSIEYELFAGEAGWILRPKK